jgi:hypothetical protein
MPPKAQKTPAEPSKSRDLVGVGPRHVQVHHQAGKRKEGRERETTTRALVLRDGKHGARGTGEVFAPARMMGREKLEILAGQCCFPAFSSTKPLIPFQRI